MISDLKFALRQLVKSPGFAFIAIATLGLCIGANSAIFSVVNAILLKPYPWPGSEHLVYVDNVFPKMGTGGSGMSIPDYLDHRTGVPSFAESALIAGYSANLSAAGNPERVYGLTATPSLFSLLQTAPFLGRGFTAAEAEPGATPTIVLTHAFWQSRFAGDPAILGRTLRLNGESYTVIGVMPEGFYFPSRRAQFWVPYAFTSQQKSEAERLTQYSTMIARLRPEATMAQAQRELDAVHRAARARLPELREEFAGSGYGSKLTGFLEQNVEGLRGMLWLLQAGVATALLIGCANIANLLLTRANARQREFAIRAALGAGRYRLMRQLLAESLVLFLLGGLAGVLVALWGLSAMDALGVGNLPRGFTVALDARVLVFTLGCALLTGLGFGALPAWAASNHSAGEALKSGTSRTTASRHQSWLRGSLAVVQISLSLMLLATAALLIRSFQRAQGESPGFATEHTLTASLSLPAAKYPTPEKRAAFAEQLTARLEGLAGVEAAGVVNAVPFGTANPQGGYSIVSRPTPPGQPGPNAMMRQVSPGYFRAMGITLLRGRLLEPTDVLGRENVVVIDRFLADRFWPGADPIGQHLNRGGNASVGRGDWTIVGVVATVKHWSLEDATAKETIYFPYAQSPNGSLTFVVRAHGNPGLLTAAVREAVLAVDPEQPVFDVKTMEARIGESLQQRRASTLLLSIFAGVALLLAALGIYGVLAFSVGQRTQEIGVRMALGADRANILHLILRQGVRLVVTGLVLGLAGYLALSTVLRSFLYHVTPTDPFVLLLAPVVLATIALLACWLPARRATKVDPMVALRAE